MAPLLVSCNEGYFVSRLHLRPLLLTHPVVRRPRLTSRQEQNVQAGVHPEHQERDHPGRASAASGSRRRRLRALRRNVRQHLSPGTRFRGGKVSSEAPAAFCSGLSRHLSLGEKIN